MGKVMVINASPRAPRSNSKQYAQSFAEYCTLPTEYFEVKASNHSELCRRMEEFSDLLFVFPLYADSLPVSLLHFLKTLREQLLKNRPVVSVIINCGFIEPEQNDVAVEMLRFYCGQRGLPFGSVFRIGSGEAILTTPFRLLLKAKMKKFAASISTQRYAELQTTMPIPKKMFLRASTSYWISCGRKNGVSEQEMRSMKIE